MAGASMPLAAGLNKANITPRYTSSSAVSKKYEVVREVGRGCYGLVQLVRGRHDGRERVCKTVSTARMRPDMLEMMRKEVNLLRSLDHPHIVRLFESAEDIERQELVLVLEYMPGASCQELLDESEAPLAEALVARIIQQVLIACAYCHARAVVHRDIKPEHMMLTKPGLWSRGQQDCKLIDFGLAQRVGDAGALKLVGTPEFMAPEVVDANSRILDPLKVDIWSIGVSAIELLSGVSPFRPSDCTSARRRSPTDGGSSFEPIYERIRRYKDFSYIEKVLEDAPAWQSRSLEAEDFAAQLLGRECARRPSAAYALQHPWIEKHKVAASGLTVLMRRSMAGYLAAQPLVRCCLLVIAARVLPQGELERIGATFVGVDADHDGKVSIDDLTKALALSPHWWSAEGLMGVLRSAVAQEPEFDPRAVVSAADFDRSDGLSFTEFAAVCLHAEYGSGQRLARATFEAFDADHDGWLHARDVLPWFQRYEPPLPRLPALPSDRPVGFEEWQEFLALALAGQRSPPTAGTARRSSSPTSRARGAQGPGRGRSQSGPGWCGCSSPTPRVVSMIGLPPQSPMFALKTPVFAGG